MAGLWEQVSSAQLRPFVRLFFEVFGLAVQGSPGTREMFEGLTGTWVSDASNVDRRAIRLGVAVSRGLLLDLLAGADPAEVRAAHELFVEMMEWEIL